MKLWFRKPAAPDYRGWEEEALPIGNGDLGGKVFGGIREERIQINEKSLWSGTTLGKAGNTNGNGKGDLGRSLRLIQNLLLKGKEEEATEQMEKLQGDEDGFGSYQSFGELVIFFPFQEPEKIEDYRRELDLDWGLLGVSFEQGGEPYRREYLASYPDKIIAVKLTGNMPECSVKLDPAQKCCSVRAEGGRLTAEGIVDGDTGTELRFGAALQIETDGILRNGKGEIRIEGASEIFLYLSVKTDYEMSYPEYRRKGEILPECIGATEKAGEKGYERIREDHIADYRELYGRVILDLLEDHTSHMPSDLLLQSYLSGEGRRYLETLLYQYGRYLLISSSRQGGLPANLQGLWNALGDPPWQSDYHLNINLQMNYWPAFSANLAETGEPLIDYLIDCLVIPGRKSAWHYTGLGDGDLRKAGGWMAHTQNNIFGHTGPGSCWRWGWAPTAGAFLLENVYEYYRFTGDIDCLYERIYPVMEEAAAMWSKLLIWDEGQDRLVVSPCFSPEHGPVSSGATFDQQLVWQLYHDTLEAGEELRIHGRGDRVDHGVTAVLKEQEPLLKPCLIGSWGQIKEWYEEDEWENRGYDTRNVIESHRHISHLLGVYPGFHPCYGEEEYRQAARTSLLDRKDESTDATPGWSKAQKLCTWARLFDGEKCYEYVEKILRENTLPNLFNTHPPFQIDGNLGYTAGVTEMLLQSHNHEIHLLPALPQAWAGEGRFSGLVARGGIRVSCSWKKGMVISAVLHAPGKTGCRVVINGERKRVELKKGDNRII